MADLQLGGVSTGFLDKRNLSGSNPAADLAEWASYGSIAAMKARLTALKPASYPAKTLAHMNDNDLTYALRLESADVAGF